MQSRFQFRAKGINGTWVRGAVSRSRDMYKIIATMEEEGAITVMRRVEENTIGQCTGLRDAAGTLIFEGDITHEEYLNPDGSRVVYAERVAWSGEGGGWTLAGNRAGALAKLSESIASEVTVVGNIHDHPELLRKA